MDPLSLSASIISVLQAAAVLIDYVTNVHNATKEQQQLAVEACNLQSLLQRLRFRVDEARPNDSWYQQVQKLGEHDGPLDQMKAALKTLRAKISPTTKTDRVKHALLWKFEKGELQESLNRIERLKGLISLALSDDHFALSEAIHTDVRDLATSVAKIQLKADRDQERLYADWLRLPDPSVNYNSALKKRQSGTGTWLLVKPEYRQWKTSPSSFIWLYGKPGCGKTILSSTVIEDIKFHSRSHSDIHLAYFYFDFNDNQKQRVDTFIRSLIFQLCSSSTFDGLEKLLNSCQGGIVQPKDDALLALLDHLLGSLATTYIVLDALDECAERHELLQTIETIRRDHHDKLHLLATSRPEQEIREFLTPLLTAKVDIQSHLVHDDIQTYIDEQLQNDSKLCRWPVNVKTEIRETLLKKADGMFRWAYCQLQSIRPCIKLPKLRAILASLPETLDQTYERILQDIESNDYLDDAIRMLQWICFARHPLALEQMVEVLAIDLDEGSFDPDNRLRDPEDLMLICSSLISTQVVPVFDSSKSEFVDKTQLRLAHFSVQEYLLSPRTKFSMDFGSAHAHHLIAEAGLVYLLHLCDLKVGSDEDIEPYPLAIYAARRWWRHLLQSGEIMTPRLTAHLDRLFHPTQKNVLIWSRLYGIDDGNYWSRLPSDIPSNLYYAAAIGSTYMVGKLIDEGTDINLQCTGRHHDALGAASSKGHEPVVRLLIEAGAQIRTVGYCHALIQATRAGHTSVVRLLLENRASVNVLGEASECALCVALAEGHDQVLHALADAGVDVHHPGNHNPAILTAARGGHLTLVNSLLQVGADPNVQSRTGETAIFLACANGHLEVARRLIEAGVDLNVFSKERFATPLTAAIFQGSEDLVRLLVDGGASLQFSHLLGACLKDNVPLVRILLEADITPKTSQNDLNHMLWRASTHGNKHVVRHLVEVGAQVNAEQANHGTALTMAAREGYDQIVKYLIDSGANVDSTFVAYDKRCTALSLASDKGHKHVVKTLLAAGAELTAHEGGIYSLLWSALYSGDEHMVQLLIKNGADINHKQIVQSSQFTSLDIASQTGRFKVVQILIDAGAIVDATSITKDANDDDVLYDSPALFRACSRGYTKIVQILLSAGADANKMYTHQGGMFSALTIASKHGFEQVVAQLIKAGADVDAWNTKGAARFNALSVALKGYHRQVAELLVRAGANVNAHSFYNSAKFSPLFTASSEGQFPIVRLLIDAGADVDAWNTDEQAKYTALAVATSRGRMPVVKMLIAAGANVNVLCSDHRGNDCTVLYIAWDHSNEPIAKVLIDAGANPNTISQHHKLRQTTAPEIAWHRARSEKLMRILQKADAADLGHEGGAPATQDELESGYQFGDLIRHSTPSSRPLRMFD